MSELTRVGPEITDVAGDLAAPAQVQRMYTRYYWARERCAGARVLEIACGTGQGLGALRRVAAAVVGSDYSMENLVRARATYGAAQPLVAHDAQALPFRDGSFDRAMLLEALYFIPDPRRALAEMARVVKPGGALLLSVINHDTADFAPSPLYVETFGVENLAAACRAQGLQPRFWGALPVSGFSWRARALRPVKRIASRLNLIPNTMQARILLKKLVFGNLTPLPAELRDADARYPAPVPLRPDAPDRLHQLLLCEATRA